MIEDISVLPEEIRPLSWLIGTWAGVGLVQYPTMEDSRYFQEVTFATDGRPFLMYHSRSWLIDENGERIRPTATESGYWKAQPDNVVELMLTHPTGYSEIWLGQLTVTAMDTARITGARIEMSTKGLMKTEGAKDYSGGTRLYGLVEDGQSLAMTMDMAAMGEPLQNHLAIKMSRKIPAVPTG